MHMWKNALEYVWNIWPIKHTQKLIDRMPKVMEAIIEAEGGENEILNSEFSLKFHLLMVIFVNFKSSVLW